MKRKGTRRADGRLDRHLGVLWNEFVNPASPAPAPALFRYLVTLLAALIFLALGAETRAQPWINPGGVGGPPPDQVTYATNRLDLDLDGAADFEIVTQVNTTYVAEIRGWAPRRTTTISLVP